MENPESDQPKQIQQQIQPDVNQNWQNQETNNQEFQENQNKGVLINGG